MVILDTQTPSITHVVRPEDITNIGVNVLIKDDADNLFEKGDGDGNKRVNEVRQHVHLMLDERVLHVLNSEWQDVFARNHRKKDRHEINIVNPLFQHTVVVVKRAMIAQILTGRETTIVHVESGLLVKVLAGPHRARLVVVTMYFPSR